MPILFAAGRLGATLGTALDWPRAAISAIGGAERFAPSSMEYFSSRGMGFFRGSGMPKPDTSMYLVFVDITWSHVDSVGIFMECEGGSGINRHDLRSKTAVQRNAGSSAC